VIRESDANIVTNSTIGIIQLIAIDVDSNSKHIVPGKMQTIVRSFFITQ